MQPRLTASTISYTCGVLSFLMLVALAFLGAGSAAAARISRSRGRTFYVAPNGRDSNSGRSVQSPWRTVGRVDGTRLEPGDRVLFEGGQTFSDAPLMPGSGEVAASGVRGDPIRFGSYGSGQARISQGIWIGSSPSFPAGPSYLTFADLSLGPVRGFQGTGDHITLTRLDISHLMPPTGQQEIGIQTEGSHWLIAHNTIDDVGSSGMLLGANANGAGDPAGGQFYAVRDNTILNTGLDPDVGYATHGIYLKVAHSAITGNRIVGFRDDGVSARYRDATIANNHIADGDIGIGWYQYDRSPGRSRFIGNQIDDMRSAGIFVCGVAEDCVRPLETFEIARNRIIGGPKRWNLQPTAGRYVIHGAN